MTHNHNFRLNEREVVKVSMMQTKGNFLAANDQELDCDILQLEYVGDVSMLIVIPRKLSGMKTLEAQLTPQVVERWQKSMTNRYFRSFVLLLSQAGVSKSTEAMANFYSLPPSLFSESGSHSVAQIGLVLITQCRWASKWQWLAFLIT